MTIIRRVTGTWLRPDGTPHHGHVTIEPTARVRVDGTWILPRVRVDLDTTGSVSVDLPVTDNPDDQPAGWVWSITEHLRREARRLHETANATVRQQLEQVAAEIPAPDPPAG